jgi:hypothetical protein
MMMTTTKTNVSKERYYRTIATQVLLRYCESEDGMLTDNGETRFESRMLDYRVDVDRVLEKECTLAERQVLLLVHRDGLTMADAIRVAGLMVPHPSRVVALLEHRVGQAFVRRKLNDLEGYLN